eukprot:CAMPEP_0196716984 /NCGR_PEP_ID=MMETSP1091-20130531/419_1 /TAXON_ID=302021 /ORGANISM="Rhodomonas sp., Strain CCMP768" /LENGTH=46 /DNA_ID= /DNA_START= /DNA_END= /DNA_ORIENTATION=
MDVTVHSPVRAEALEFESHSTLLTLKDCHPHAPASVCIMVRGEERG